MQFNVRSQYIYAWSFYFKIYCKFLIKCVELKSALKSCFYISDRFELFEKILETIGARDLMQNSKITELSTKHKISKSNILMNCLYSWAFWIEEIGYIKAVLKPELCNVIQLHLCAMIAPCLHGLDLQLFLQQTQDIVTFLTYYMYQTCWQSKNSFTSWILLLKHRIKKKRRTR